mmetsp:Transcript_38946/g.101471  ORF Transcript_38946/g.101471 Transcript_38946/m.101471 type:complete len:80 (+) Transcript_38946:91-330(+)
MVSVSPRPLVENRLVLIAAAIFVGLIAFGPTPSFAQDGEQVSGAPSGELHRILIMIVAGALTKRAAGRLGLRNVGVMAA